jgi:hypothetical protein
MRDLPPAAELFTLKQLAERYPQLMPVNRLRWAVRHRHRNGLAAAGAVYESPVAGIILHGPSTLAWLLGLTGRAKPRASRRR